MQKAFRIESLADGKWTTLAQVDDNHQRLVRIPVNAQVEAVRVVFESTWGTQQSRLYAFYAD
jgi:hypothetical protein